MVVERVELGGDELIWVLRRGGGGSLVIGGGEGRDFRERNRVCESRGWWLGCVVGAGWLAWVVGAILQGWSPPRWGLAGGGDMVVAVTDGGWGWVMVGVFFFNKVFY